MSTQEYSIAPEVSKKVEEYEVINPLLDEMIVYISHLRNTSSIESLRLLSEGNSQRQLARIAYEYVDVIRSPFISPKSDIVKSITPYWIGQCTDVDDVLDLYHDEVSRLWKWVDGHEKRNAILSTFHGKEFHPEILYDVDHWVSSAIGAYKSRMLTQSSAVAFREETYELLEKERFGYRTGIQYALSATHASSISQSFFLPTHPGEMDTRVLGLKGNQKPCLVHTSDMSPYDENRYNLFSSVFDTMTDPLVHAAIYQHSSFFRLGAIPRHHS